MATFIRNHPTATDSSAGTTVSINLAAAVPAGRTLIATLGRVGGTSSSGAGISKPGGESASWVMLADRGVQTSGGGGTQANLSIWAIRTTVGWASGQTVTGTVAAGGAGRMIGIAELEGVTTEVVSSDSAWTNLSGPVSAATTEVMRAGDVTVQARVSLFSTLPETSSGGTATGTRQSLASDSVASGYFGTTAYLINGSGGRNVVYADNGGPRGALIVGLKALSYPPNTPTLTTNADGRTLDRGRTIRLGWSFSSPNAVDSQSQYDLRYRLVGAGSWTTVTQATTNTFRDFAGGDLAAGDYEWQVLYYGALGQASGWSASGFFTAADAPDGPTITYPVDGQTVEQLETATWSTPVQDSYQLRRVADDAGDPDPGTIYFESGEVLEPTTRARLLNFSVNNRTEHVQVRVKNAGLWSDWDDVLVDVAYTPPPVPTRTLYVDPSTASLLVVIANPVPTGDAPAAVYNDIYVDDGAGLVWVATGVSTNGSWRYWTPRSGRDYGTAGRLVVVAVAANGTTSSSDGS